MTSLITIIREKLLEALRSVQPARRWKVLVLDVHSERIVFNVLKRNDVLDEGVSRIVVNSSVEYEPQPNEEAMYVLMPTTRNIERIVDEFSEGRQQFQRVHLFFLDALADDLFARLTQSPAEPFLACLTELYVNFWPTEAQVFSVESPSFFFSMFSPPRGPQAIKAARDRLMEDLQYTAKIITNTCIALNEFPYIRYYQPSHHAPLGPLVPTAELLPPPPVEGSGRWRTNLARGAQAREYDSAEREYLCKILAGLVQGALEDHQKANADFPKPEQGRQRATLLITDRSMDTVAPLIHEFTYQAMANDLLRIEDGRKYTYQLNGKDVTVKLDDGDPVWVDLRHMHMREAIDKLMGDFNRFLQEHTSFRGEEPASLDAMRDMIASLPQYQDQRDKFSVHLNMAQECMSIFEKRKLPVTGNVEQNCATGLTPEGKTPKTLVEEMVPLLDSRDITNRDKVRIIALYIQHREGVPDEDRRRLYQHARLTLQEMDAINSLAHLGARITRTPADKDLKKRIKAKPTGADVEYDLSRYRPVLQTVIDDQVAGKLDQIAFPYIKDSPATLGILSSAKAPPPPQTTSLRSARPNWHTKPKQGAAPVGGVRQRLLVFVAGGMTYSEMRTAYEQSTALNRDVIIGSTHIYSPEWFLDDLKSLELGGAASRSTPNGLRKDPCMSFQQYYDERYFTQDLPPVRTASAPVVDREKDRGFFGGLAPPKLTSSVSLSSVRSNDSGASGAKKLEKKKRGIFGF